MKRNREKGQAITEFVISILGILFVFLGLLVVAILAMENVRSIVDARSEIDISSEHGSSIGGESPKAILSWSDGSDGIPFTGDDTPQGGMMSTSYSNLFNTANDTFDDTNTAVTGPDPKAMLHISKTSLFTLSEGGYVDADRVNTTFLGAANLSGATVTVRDPLSARGLPDLEQLLRSFTGNASFFLTDTVFMPARME